MLYSFGGSEVVPNALTIGKGGVLYGTTSAFAGGTSGGGNGTVFSLTPPASSGGAWTGNILYTFQGGADGSGPNGALTIASGVGLYGTTEAGGSTGNGTVFLLAPPETARGTWTKTVLYNFAGGTDSALPGSALALKNGLLYGTASGGTSNYGTVFSLTPPATTGGTWTERVLFDFGGGTNGGYPTNVVFGEGGKLYGATEVGTNSGGTIFELNP